MKRALRTKLAKRFSVSLVLVMALIPDLFASDDTNKTTIAIIGDSTACDYKAASPRRGWGQVLPDFLPSDVIVINLARSGASTKTFPNANWQKVLNTKPQYILIQFGHNDSHSPEKPEATDAATEFRDNLRRYIREAREAEAEPILVTPVRRRLFKNGEPTKELRPYAEAMQVVADDMDVPVIDLYRSSGELYAELGEEASDAYTLNKTDMDDRPGNGDRTHFTETGARAMAGLVAEELVIIIPEISPSTPSAQ